MTRPVNPNSPMDEIELPNLGEPDLFSPTLEPSLLDLSMVDEISVNLAKFICRFHL